ncbi:hypothetical protein BC835DRAFT_1375147 [Cytidiella melzeri]|nr:hypothetical protein BC835DRAFT_1375147 [Cytidiella melzeri]
MFKRLSLCIIINLSCTKTSLEETLSSIELDAIVRLLASKVKFPSLEQVDLSLMGANFRRRSYIKPGSLCESDVWAFVSQRVSALVERNVEVRFNFWPDIWARYF